MTVVLERSCVVGYRMDQTDYTLPEPLVTTSADTLGGHPCFTGRRVPIQALFDYLTAGLTIGRFLVDYPNVSRKHAAAVIELAHELMRPPVAAE
jgi:uncharacterized protein (DUF433 family)